MSEKKQINLGINDGTEFFAHELSLNFNPMQFIFDFKCMTPRNDARSRDTPFISLKHNIVMVDPWHAKQILELLSSMVKRYEEQFGKIEKPKALKRHEKNRKNVKSKKPAKTKAPSYLG